MSKLSNEEIFERLVNNSANRILYEYGLENISMEKLINRYTNEKNEINYNELCILINRLKKEGNTEYVKENSYRLLGINSLNLRNAIIEVSSLEKLEKGFKKFSIDWLSVYLNTLDKRLKQESNTEYVKNEAVKFLLYIDCSGMDYNINEEYKKLIQTIVNVSSIKTLISTLDNDLYMENITYVDFVIKKLKNEKHIEDIEKLYNKPCKLNSIGFSKIIASIAPIDVLVEMASLSQYDEVARIMVSRFEELINKE